MSNLFYFIMNNYVKDMYFFYERYYSWFVLHKIRSMLFKSICRKNCIVEIECGYSINRKFSHKPKYVVIFLVARPLEL